LKGQTFSTPIIYFQLPLALSLSIFSLPLKFYVALGGFIAFNFHNFHEISQLCSMTGFFDMEVGKINFH
jgi:hypothetical protein